MRMKFLHERLDGGFSLIEMLVSIGIFSLVMLVSVAAVVSMVNTSRHARAVKSVADNLGFAMESMSRNIKIGSGYSRDGSYASLSFTDFRGGPCTYSLDLGNNAINQNCHGVAGAITAPEVVVESLLFNVTGSSGTDTLQPRVRINLKARSRGGQSAVNYALQTTVSQRALDEPQS